VRCIPVALAALIVVSCSSAPPATATPTLVSDLVIPTTVPNGTVDVVVKRGYTVGETVRATVRLRPTSGTLRGPLDPFIQASGFSGTATVRRLTVDPVTANAGNSEMVVVAWDLHDDAGTAVGGDDYSLVFNVIDNTGRTATVGVTLQVR
jgi:hypothetical protein